MSSKVIKFSDTSTGHGNCVSVLGLNKFINTEVFAEDILIIVENDIFNTHTGGRNCGSHVVQVNPGGCSPGVTIQGKRVAVDKGSLTCGDTLKSISPTNVIIGDVLGG